MVDDGKYFTINRARQYGKTTTLYALCVALEDDYIVISLDFQDLSDTVFESEGAFAQGMARIICDEADAKENSPWNIAADFTVDMSLSEAGIKGMLDEYEADHQTGMDTAEIAKQIWDNTNGYPFLVSRICQIIDQRMLPDTFASLKASWTSSGVEEAVKFIITEKNTLFDSLMGKIRSFDRLRGQLKQILFQGETIAYLPDNKEQEQLMISRHTLVTLVVS